MRVHAIDPQPDTRVAPRGLTPNRRLLIVLAVALIAIAAYMLINVTGNLEFVFSLRTKKVAAMALVGWSAGVATVAFQTVTNNRLLTPAILGLDALYVFIQTMLILVLGITFTTQLGVYPMFALNTALMMAGSVALTALLFGRRGRSVYLLVLAGLVMGSVLRSLSSLITRVLDPTSYLVLQNNLFASFSTVNPELLWGSTALVAVASVWLWMQRGTLDVLTLGRESAVSLGVDYPKVVRRVILVATLLICVSTALVGPITFLGLIVAAIAYQIAGSGKHAYTLPMAGALGLVTLVGGQAILEHLFDLSTVLSVIIEFVGGIAFIWLVIRKVSK